MAGQERITPQRRDGGPADDAPEPLPGPAAQAQVAGDDIDSVLDEIDSVLETNSEEFVRGFVQKGGQ